MPLSYLDGKPLKYTGTVRVAREDLDRDAIDGSILDMVREARAVRRPRQAKCRHPRSRATC